jgi:poly-gamma-glutamate capsule biosynthesis protein CapA/YwtB (metallophosphatase superfamily)
MRRLIAALFLLLVPAALAAEELRLLFCGDFLISVGVERRALTIAPDYPYGGIREIMRSHDYVFINLESPVTDRGTAATNKRWVFRALPESAWYLGFLNISAASIANNHIMDFGYHGLEDTQDFLRAMGISHGGAGRDDAEARMPARVIIRGQEIIMLCYNTIGPKNFRAGPGHPGAAYFDPDTAIADVRSWKRKNNLVFVSLHWGAEIVRYPSPDQIRQARALIDAGADGIIGHHPHIPQGVEKYKGKPILYSLGNAVCGFYNKNYTANIFASMTVRGGEIRRVAIVPVSGDNYRIHFRPHVLTGTEADAVLDDIELQSVPFRTRFRRENDTLILR